MHTLSGDGIANETVASGVGGVVAIGGSVLALSGDIVASAGGTGGTAGAIDAGSGIRHTLRSAVVVDASLSGAGRISGAGDGGIVALCFAIDDGANIVGASIVIVTDSRAEGSTLSCGGIASVDSAGSDGGRAGVGDGGDAHTLGALGGGNDRTTKTGLAGDGDDDTGSILAFLGIARIGGGAVGVGAGTIGAVGECDVSALSGLQVATVKGARIIVIAIDGNPQATKGGIADGGGAQIELGANEI